MTISALVRAGFDELVSADWEPEARDQTSADRFKIAVQLAAIVCLIGYFAWLFHKGAVAYPHWRSSTLEKTSGSFRPLFETSAAAKLLDSRDRGLPSEQPGVSASRNSTFHCRSPEAVMAKQLSGCAGFVARPRQDPDRECISASSS